MKLKGKLLLIIFIIIFTFFHLKGQEYESVFGTESTSWNFLREIGDGIVTDSTYYVGDTLINEIEYRIIDRNKIFYFVRESESNDKLWLLDPLNDNNEMLIYDLSLSTDDLFMVDSGGKINSSVDSVYFKDNRKHIKLDYLVEGPAGEEALTFVEGVGTNYGILYKAGLVDQIGSEHYMLCSYKNNSLMYQNKSPRHSGICRVNWTRIFSNEVQDDSFVIGPNPCKNFIKIQSNIMGSEHTKITLYSITGEVYFRNIYFNDIIEIELSDINAGVYIVELVKGNSIYHKKLIKKI